MRRLIVAGALNAELLRAIAPALLQPLRSHCQRVAQLHGRVGCRIVSVLSQSPPPADDTAGSFKVATLLCNMQQTLCNMQQSIGNMQQTLCNMQQAIGNMQQTVFYVRCPCSSGGWKFLRCLRRAPRAERHVCPPRRHACAQTSITPIARAPCRRSRTHARTHKHPTTQSRVHHACTRACTRACARTCARTQVPMLSGEMRRAASTRDWQVLVRPCARARVCEFARAILALAHGAGVAHERLPRLGLADVTAQCGLDGLVHIHPVLEGGERED